MLPSLMSSHLRTDSQPFFFRTGQSENQEGLLPAVVDFYETSQLFVEFMDSVLAADLLKRYVSRHLQ